MIDNIIKTPTEILEGLNVETNDYGHACEIGAKCADDYVAALRKNGYLIGTGRIADIAKRLAESESHRAIAIGFFARLDRLLVDGARLAESRAVAEKFIELSNRPPSEAHSKN